MHYNVYLLLGGEYLVSRYMSHCSCSGSPKSLNTGMFTYISRGIYWTPPPPQRTKMKRVHNFFQIKGFPTPDCTSTCVFCLESGKVSFGNLYLYRLRDLPPVFTTFCILACPRRRRGPCAPRGPGAGRGSHRPSRRCLWDTVCNPEISNSKG